MSEKRRDWFTADVSVIYSPIPFCTSTDDTDDGYLSSSSLGTAAIKETYTD